MLVFWLKLGFLQYINCMAYVKIILGAPTACYEKRGNSNQETKTQEHK